MKKNTRVMMKGTKDTGTVIGNPYRHVTSGDRFVEVLFDSNSEIVNVLVEALEVIE